MTFELLQWGDIMVGKLLVTGERRFYDQLCAKLAVELRRTAELWPI